MYSVQRSYVCISSTLLQPSDGQQQWYICTEESALSGSFNTDEITLDLSAFSALFQLGQDFSTDWVSSLPTAVGHQGAVSRD